MLSIIAQDDNLRHYPKLLYNISDKGIYTNVIGLRRAFLLRIFFSLSIMPIPLETLFLTYVICGIMLFYNL